MFHQKGFGGMQRAPINEGDEFQVTIESVGEKGDGIARVKGFVIFVPGVKQGETVTVRVTRVLRKFAFGEVVDGSGSAAKASEDEPQQEDDSEESKENEKDDTDSDDDDNDDNDDEDSENFGDEEEKN